MALTHGMNIEEVRRIGNRIRNENCSSIDALMKEIESMVTSTESTWQGPDANAFRSWWPSKRTMLQNIRNELNDFGNKAVQNADAQQNTSNQA